MLLIRKALIGNSPVYTEKLKRIKEPLCSTLPLFNKNFFLESRSFYLKKYYIPGVTLFHPSDKFEYQQIFVIINIDDKVMIKLKTYIRRQAIRVKNQGC